MTPSTYRFELKSKARFDESERTLHLAVVAAEGLFGEARVRMEFAYWRDPTRSVLLVDGSNEVGNAIIRIFTGLLIREFGTSEFAVRPVPPNAGAITNGSEHMGSARASRLRPSLPTAPKRGRA